MATSNPRLPRTALALVLGSSAQLAFAATLTVGTDASSCDYTDIPAAISNAQKFDTIQVEAAEFVGAAGTNFNILGKSVFLEGGFAPGCNGEITFVEVTVLKGGGSDSVVEIVSTGGDAVELANMRVVNGTDDPDFGGGIQISGDVHVTLNNVSVSNNESERGGGLHIDGSSGATVFIRDFTGITSNRALRLDTSDPRSGAGGGLYCDNGATVFVQEPASISFNAAEQHGGGIYADGCNVEVMPEAGTRSGVRLRENRSDHDGGGLYVSGGSRVLADGGRDGELFIKSNTAGTSATVGNGGALYVTGLATEVSISGGDINENFADNGGGVFVTEDARFELNQGSCSADRCQELSDNVAGFGASIAVSARARAFLSNTWVADNRSAADSASGAAGVVTSSGLLDFKNAIVVNNGPFTGVAPGAILAAGGNLEVDDSTFSGNRNNEYLFTGSGDLPVQNSIFWDNDGTVFDPGWTGALSLDCAVVPPGTATPVGATEIATHDPLFKLPPVDYHLQEDSPAIDQCSNMTETIRDIDGDRRPQGPRYDPGVDEVEVPIFEDSFEGP